MAKAECGYTYHSKFSVKYTFIKNILEMEKFFFQNLMDGNGKSCKNTEFDLPAVGQTHWDLLLCILNSMQTN